MSLTDEVNQGGSSTKKDKRGAPSSYSRPHKDKVGQPPPRMVRLTVSLPGDLVDRLRDAVYWSPSLTLAWLITQSLRTTLRELESLREGPFPKRTNALRVGRPRLVGQTMNLSSRVRFIGNGTACSTKEGA